MSNRDRRSEQQNEEQNGDVGRRIGLASLVLLVTGFIWRFLGRKGNPDRNDEPRLQPHPSPGYMRNLDADNEEGALGRPAEWPDPHSIAAGYEVSDLSTSGIYKFSLFLLVSMAIVLGVVTFLQYVISGTLGDLTPPATGLDDPPNVPIPAIMQSRSESGVEYNELRANEDQILNSYGWVDEEGGTVRIPIDRAIELLAEEGLPARTDGLTGNEYWSETGQQIPSYPSSGRSLEQRNEWIYAETVR